MRNTDIEITFRVPYHAYKLLEIMRRQNNTLGFRLHKHDNSITLYCDLIDFPSYTNDCNDIGDFEEYALEERK